MTWPGRVKEVSLLCRIYDEDGAALRSEEDSGRHALVSCTYGQYQRDGIVSGSKGSVVSEVSMILQ